MKPATIEKFLIQNLDCANCAAKIKRELRATEGVDEAVIDFANLALHLKAIDVRRALDTVARTELGVILTNIKAGATGLLMTRWSRLSQETPIHVF